MGLWWAWNVIILTALINAALDARNRRTPTADAAEAYLRRETARR